MAKIFSSPRFLSVLVGFLVCGIAAAAGYVLLFRPTSELAPRDAALETIRVANIGQFSIFNLIASENGYFEDHGLDAMITEYDSGATSIRALLDGEADIAVAADFVGVTNLFATDELRILAVVSDHDVFRVVARRDSGIGSPTDLRGKKIGVTRRTAGEYYLSRFLAFHNIPIVEVAMVDMSPSQYVHALTSGEVDAALAFEPHAYTLQQSLGNLAVSWSAQRGQRALALVYTTESYLQHHHGTIERYLRSLVDAEQYVQAHEDAAKSLMQEYFGEDPAYVEYIWPEFVFAIELKQDLLLTMEAQARWMIENDLMDAATIPNYLPFIYFDALERVKPEAVMIVH